MIKRYICFAIICLILTKSYQAFAVGDVGKVELHTNFNGNENLVKNENLMTVNYFNEDGTYNVLFGELKKDQIIDVQSGKYKLDFIEFLDSYELKLKLSAPKEFEVVKDKTTKLTFEVVKDPNQTQNPIFKKAEEMEKKYAAERESKNTDDKNKKDFNENSKESTNKSNSKIINKNTSKKIKKTDKNSNKTANKKLKFNIDYFAIILLIGLVITLIILKRKSGINVKK